MTPTSSHAEVNLLQRPFRTPKGANPHDIEAYLVVLTSAMMEDHSTSTYDILRAHCHEEFKMVDFSAHECGLPQANSLQHHISNVEALKSVHPHWKVNPFNFSVIMYDDLEKAIVWFTSPGSDIPGDWMTNRESVHRVHWRRMEDGVWKVYMHSSLRGPGNIFLQSNDYERGLKDVFVSHAVPKRLFSQNEMKN